MEILLIIGIVIASLIALVLVVALFVKKDYMLQREIVIQRPQQFMYDYLRHLGNQTEYSKWVMDDPNMNRVPQGGDGTVGFVLTWDSKDKNVGAGRQEIIQLMAPTLIKYVVQFIRPFKGKADCSFELSAVSDNQTRIKWTFESGMAYPMNFMMLFLDIAKMLGKDMEKSLNTLKSVLESR